jgi:hypothetical protein
MKRPDLLLAIVFGACLALALPAAAQKPAASSKSANIGGAWNFVTQSYANGCRMSGVMMIRQSNTGKYSCTFQTEEKCPDITVRAKEACEAVRDGGALKITSKVTSVEPQVGYDPDNFELTIQNGARMTGMMRSFNSAPVEFFRGDAPVS